MDSLNINKSAFDSLKQKEQINLIYENTEQLKQMVGGFKFQQKIQWVAIGLLVISIGAGKYIGLL